MTPAAAASGTAAASCAAAADADQHHDSVPLEPRSAAVVPGQQVAADVQASMDFSLFIFGLLPLMSLHNII